MLFYAYAVVNQKDTSKTTAVDPIYWLHAESINLQSMISTKIKNTFNFHKYRYNQSFTFKRTKVPSGCLNLQFIRTSVNQRMIVNCQFRNCVNNLLYDRPSPVSHQDDLCQKPVFHFFPLQRCKPLAR